MGKSVFGFSMGGYIMLYLLSMGNRRNFPVITLGTKFNWNEETAAEETGRIDADKLLEKVPAFARMLDLRHDNWRLVMENTKDLMLELGKKPLLTEDNVKNIENVALIMRGSADKMVTSLESERIAGWLPNDHPLEQALVKNIAEEVVKFIHNDQK